MGNLAREARPVWMQPNRGMRLLAARRELKKIGALRIHEQKRRTPTMKSAQVLLQYVSGAASSVSYWGCNRSSKASP